MSELGEKAGKAWVLALASVASCMTALDALAVTTASPPAYRSREPLPGREVASAAPSKARV
jgi:hypothetical protein